MPSLQGKVALVAGATRGAGRGIARMLGEAGATVYCTGRGSREHPSAAGAYAGRSETIEDTAELTTAAGGKGIAVRVDHTDSAQVTALIDRIRKEQGRLDILVPVLGGLQVKQWDAFWKLDLAQGRALIESWLWTHLVTCHAAVPLLIEHKGGLIVEVTEGETIEYRGQYFFDLASIALKRMVHSLAEELATHGTTAVAIAPGFMRTEAVLDHFKATEATWQEIARTSKEAQQFMLHESETPCFIGRAVAALAADRKKARWSGAVLSAWDLAEEYGFTDVDGRNPRWGKAFAEFVKSMPGFGKPRLGFKWDVVVRQKA
jgi:NAD(P)-dependent dehydrogenase (short-subunit alcohol dehydrogenase family)